MILKVYIACSLLCLILSLMIAHVGKERFKKEHPHVKTKKVGIYEKGFSTIRLIALCFVPILNVLCIISFLFYTEKVLDNMMEKLEDMIIEEGENNETE